MFVEHGFMIYWQSGNNKKANAEAASTVNKAEKNQLVYTKQPEQPTNQKRVGVLCLFIKETFIQRGSRPQTGLFPEVVKIRCIYFIKNLTGLYLSIRE